MSYGCCAWKVLFWSLILALAAGCAGSPPSRFYTLSPLAQEGMKAPSRQGNSPVSVSIAPVEIPDYLDRPQMVTREGGNELKFAEFDRWAGSLGDNISAVLAENLSKLLASDRVYVYPRLLPGKADYTVAMRVLRLDCTPGERVMLKAQWTISDDRERKEIATRMSTFNEALGDRQYGTMAAAVSRAVGELSREIAKEITTRRE